MPGKKMLILAMALNPIFMAQMVSYSADGTLNSLSLFYVAYIFMLKKKEKIRIVDMIVVFISSIIISLSKVIYFPFVFMVFLLSDKQFRTKKSAGLYKLFTFICSLTMGIIWFCIAKSYLFDTVSADVRPNMQFKYILSHIYLAPQIAFNTISEYIYGWTCQLFGGVFGQGWLTYKDIIWMIFGGVVIVELFTSRKDEEEADKIVKKDRIMIWASVILIIGLTFSSLYVQWTAYQADMVHGIQGRYFIPLVLPIGIAVRRKRVDGSCIKRSIIEVICLLFAVMMAIVNTMQAYT